MGSRDKSPESTWPAFTPILALRPARPAAAPCAGSKVRAAAAAAAAAATVYRTRAIAVMYGSVADCRRCCLAGSQPLGRRISPTQWCLWPPSKHGHISGVGRRCERRGSGRSEGTNRGPGRSRHTRLELTVSLSLYQSTTCSISGL